MYIGIDNEEVSKDDHIFSGSRKAEKCKVTVFPQDAKYMCGTWNIQIVAPTISKDKEMTVCIMATLLEAR